MSIEERKMYNEFRRLQEQAEQIFRRKHHDYGPCNIALTGLPGVIVRMSDKVSRLRNLVLKNKEPNNESIEDNLIDVANYAIIALLVMAGKWPECEDEE